jgi:hypothetical protein
MPNKPRTTLPAFTPVPRLKQRSNGWSPAIQLAFIEALAETGSVAAAARRVNRAPEGAYLLRRHPEAKTFRKAWQAALDLGVQKIEDVAMDRALNGVEVPVYSYGKLVGTRTVYNDRLLMFMLRNRAPKRFAEGGAKGLNAVDKMMLARLKKQWREEWERESAQLYHEDEQELFDEIDAQLERSHQNRLALQSPRTRELYEAARASEEADRASGYAHLAVVDGDAGEWEEDEDGEDRDSADGGPVQKE